MFKNFLSSFPYCTGCFYLFMTCSTGCSNTYIIHTGCSNIFVTYYLLICDSLNIKSLIILLCTATRFMGGVSIISLKILILSLTQLHLHFQLSLCVLGAPCFASNIAPCGQQWLKANPIKMCWRYKYVILAVFWLNFMNPRCNWVFYLSIYVSCFEHIAPCNCIFAVQNVNQFDSIVISVFFLCLAMWTIYCTTVPLTESLSYVFGKVQ